MASQMELEEFEFPDEKEAKQPEASAKEEEFEIEIEDDTPEPDRGRQPLPQNVVEDLDKDELEEYSENVKTKLKQLKKVWHDERREKERALREHQEAIELAKRVMEENNSLKGRLTQGEKTFLDTYKIAAERELNEAKRAYKDAYDRGDPDQILEAQDQISEAQYKLQKAREYVPSLQREESVVQTAPEIPASRPDPKMMAWQERNQWFGRDPEMTSLALGLHQKLVSEYGEAYPSTDEYWNKVDITMRRRFPEYFDGQQQNTQEETQSTNRQRTEKAPAVVAPATRSTTSKKVKIKQSTLNMIKKLGITPEQYIREQRLLEARNG